MSSKSEKLDRYERKSPAGTKLKSNEKIGILPKKCAKTVKNVENFENPSSDSYSASPKT